VALAAPASSAGTDTVTLANGDHLTGEVKGLERGRLRFKTDSLDTVFIEWEDVVRLMSSEVFEVELDSGLKHFGALGSGDPEVSELVVTGADGEAVLPLASIVRITPIEHGFWQRQDGSLSLGLSVAKASDSRQFNVDFDSSSRSPKWLRTLNVASNITSQEGVEDLSRSSVSFYLIRYLEERKLLLAFGQLQENEELALELRTLAGVAYGRYLKQTSHSELALYGGLAANREDFGDPGGPNSELEAVGALELSVFTFDTPETQLDLHLFVYPGLTDSGRGRAELEVSLRRELVEDFFLTLSAYDSYDSEPPVEGLEKNDWWLVTGLGWSW
jgi:hypothetical protein